MVKTKKIKNHLTIMIVSLLVSFVGVSFAAFLTGYLGGSNLKANLDVTTVPELIFGNEGDLILVADSNNFSGNENIVSNTTTRATLSSPGEYTTLYNFYIKVNYNDFVYTSEEKVPELLLKIYDKDGTEVTQIDGLNYKTVDGLSGFDITTVKCGTYIVKEDIEIASDGIIDETDNYNVELIFVNLGINVNQNLNFEKKMNVEVILTQEYLEFDDDCCIDKNVSIFGDIVINNNGGTCYIESKGQPDYTLHTETVDGMYATEDNYGVTYYFRGAAENNWVYYAGYYWRIVRVNGDGSIKLIYTGELAPSYEERFVMIGNGTSIGQSYYNDSSWNIETQNYMYTVGEHRGNETSSLIKKFVDEWYELNIYGTIYENSISDTPFCYDRTAYTIDGQLSVVGYGEVSPGVYFQPFISMYMKTLNLICSNEDDLFSIAKNTEGNGALDYPIGLLTAEDAILSGVSGINTYNNYSDLFLYSGNTIWLASGGLRYSSRFHSISSSTVGKTTLVTDSSLYVRPVVNLKGSLISNGDGSWDNPYSILQ